MVVERYIPDVIILTSTWNNTSQQVTELKYPCYNTLKKSFEDDYFTKLREEKAYKVKLNKKMKCEISLHVLIVVSSRLGS